MAEASYDRQHLALHAAGFINALGTTMTVFGCQMTRISTGVYAMVLPPDAGVVDDESWTLATGKGSNPVAAVVSDTSNTVKRVTVNGVDASPADADVEVALWKSVTR